jgi:hypothetical protein
MIHHLIDCETAIKITELALNDKEARRQKKAETPQGTP